MISQTSIRVANKEWLVAILLLICLIPAVSQHQSHHTIKVKKGWLIITDDTTYLAHRDTVLVLTTTELQSIRFRESPQLTSSRFYDSLRRRASGNKLSREVLDLIVKKKKKKDKLVNATVKSEESFKPFKGLIIRSITFKTVDLIEGSVIDTLEKATTAIGRFINRAHADTRPGIIRQNLLFKVGDAIDPYTLADNERILRQLKILRDARIYIQKNKTDRTGADVTVVTQDVSSIGVSGSFRSLKKYRADLYDINILGYSRQLRLSYFRNKTAEPQNGYEVILREPNLYGTFLQGALTYTNNYLRERTQLVLGRDFYTPAVKYAGGLDLYHTHENFYFETYDTLQTTYTEIGIDAWAGRSFEIKKRTNLILATRINRRTFRDAPLVASDSNSFFYNRTLVLGSISFTKRNYMKSLRIQGFGRTEDILIGGSATALFGKEMNPFADRLYAELNGSIGHYLTTIGYVNASFVIGSFYKQGTMEDGLVSLSGTYFSDLVNKRRMQLRQFVYFSYIRGINRALKQTVSINGRWRDLVDRPPNGNERITLGFETVYFMPWYGYGFQFALFYRLDAALLIHAAPPSASPALYPSLRGGARLLNENLTLPTLLLELAFYGKNKLFNNKWEFRIAITIPDLFVTNQRSKPQIAAFN